MFQEMLGNVAKTVIYYSRSSRRDSE